MTNGAKKSLFILVATLANMLAAAVIIVAVFAGLSALSMLVGIKNPVVGVVVSIVSFLAGIILSGVAYTKVLKAIQKKPELADRFGLLDKEGRNGRLR